MSTERLAERLGETANRRRFLGKAGAGALTFAMVLLGQSQTAEAVVAYRCCSLCRSPSSTCSGASCSWCWHCCYQSGGRILKYRCCEYYRRGYSCNGGCSGVFCSRAWVVARCE